MSSLFRTPRAFAVLILLFMEVLWASATVRAQNPPEWASPLLPEENGVTHVSGHVYAILGYFPNIEFVVGDRATLVVDTGMGPRNGTIVAREAEKLSKGPMLFLTTTHFHPEHATGAQVFPPRTVLIRPAVQQEELERVLPKFIQLFSNMSALNKGLLQDVKPRPPDILFDREIKLDLGGVTARLLWLGAAHTQGDEVIFVEEDSVLIPGDIVQNKLIPMLPDQDASLKGWLAILDKLEPLKPRIIVPDHGAIGDGSLIAPERAFLLDLQTRALQLKSQGMPVEQAGQMIRTEFKAKYPDWTGVAPGIPNAVRRVYEESQGQ